MEKQKVIAQRVLQKLEAIDPYCILAGGAPRDWWWGNEAADLDFYIYVPDRPHKAIKKQIERAGLVVKEVKTGENMPINYKLNPFLRCVIDIEEEMPVQIMVMSEPTFKSVVPTFALSVCQAWWKGGDVSVSKEFLAGARHNAIVKTNPLYHNEHYYLEKILAKFPNMKYYSSKEEFLDAHFYGGM